MDSEHIVKSYDNDQNNDSNQNNEGDNLDVLVKERVINTKDELFSDLVLNILLQIQNDQEFMDKHTTKSIQEVIERKAENDKESNLKFIEELDKESRQSFKVMVSIGLDSYKSLSTKDRDLYFPTQVETENEHDDMLQQQMDDENNRYMARQELGENMTQGQYSEWLENRRVNMAEDRLAYDDRDILSDDDE